MRSTAVNKKEGMDCLVKTLGILETEIFISTLSRESFDYTEWQRDYFANWPLDAFLQKAQEYDKKNPYYINE